MKQKEELLREKLIQSPRIPDRERQAVLDILMNFESIEMPLSDKVANFTNWARTRDIARFLARYELHKEIINIPGCIFECGVHWGGGVSSWLHLSEIYEPVAFTRRIYGFDTFKGFVDVGDIDNANHLEHKKGDFSLGDSSEKIIETLKLVEETRKISVENRFQLINGDISKTMPELLESDKSISIALLYLDLDLYEPTKETLENCLPRMPKGSIVVLDEFADPDWPGETQALMDTIGINNVEMRSFPFTPRISYFKV